MQDIYHEIGHSVHLPKDIQLSLSFSKPEGVASLEANITRLSCASGARVMYLYPAKIWRPAAIADGTQYYNDDWLRTAEYLSYLYSIQPDSPLSTEGGACIAADPQLSYVVSGRRQTMPLEPMIPPIDTDGEPLILFSKNVPAAMNFVRSLQCQLWAGKISLAEAERRRADYRNEFSNFEEMLQITGVGILPYKGKKVFIANPMCCWALSAHLGLPCRAHHTNEPTLWNSNFFFMGVNYDLPENAYNAIFSAFGFPRYVSDIDAAFENFRIKEYVKKNGVDIDVLSGNVSSLVTSIEYSPIELRESTALSSSEL